MSQPYHEHASHERKFVGINLHTDTVDRMYLLDWLTAADNGIDDVRFGAGRDIAYLRDTAGALLVLNLKSSYGVRVLVNDPSALTSFSVTYNGSFIPGYQGPDSTITMGLGQIKVSPDGV